MEGMVQEFFKNLYTTDSNVSPDGLIQNFDQRISDDDNRDLCKEFTDDEISAALFQIRPLKAPRPDGFPVRFFQRNLLLRKLGIIRGVKKLFEMGQMPLPMNEIAIILIPKKIELELLKDFRPISLCNVIYKVVAKCLVNMLRPLLHDIIEPTQSAFTPSRMITNNALIAFECLHALRNGNQKCKKFGAYKLDLTKAYNRVDWGFLEGVLKLLGFHSTWV
jgi:hypothetical protein